MLQIILELCVLKIGNLIGSFSSARPISSHLQGPAIVNASTPEQSPFEPNPYLEGSGYQPPKLINGTLLHWADMNVPPALKENACQVWATGLDQSEKCEAHFREFLSAPELSRADQYYDPVDRKRYTIARGLLRILIGRYLGKHPTTIQFEYSEHGKPKLLEKALHFSKTSSAGLGLITFSRESELGIDLEQTREIDDLPSLSKKLFSAEEHVLMQEAQPSERIELFYNVWTRKEAVLKAMGTGLFFPPDQLTVSLQSSPEFELAIQGGPQSPRAKWQLKSFSPTAGFQAALAIRADKASLSFFRLIA